jgi:undecaprenyl-phosphate 4-deoxy-4-formamido-L-arabinose transferase
MTTQPASLPRSISLQDIDMFSAPPVQKVSVVIPVYNEQESLPELIRRTTAACETLGKAYEILLVDDGSIDNSARMLTDAAQAEGSHIVAVLLNRNYGQHSAIMAGFSHVTGDLVITLDADLQNPPEEIPRLVAKADEGYDVVGTVRQNRQDSLFRKLASRTINRLIQRTTGKAMGDYGCMLRLNAATSSTPCCTAMSAAPSFRFWRTPLPVKRRRSRCCTPSASTGSQSNSFMSLINLMYDLITCLTTTPLRLLSCSGSVIRAGRVCAFRSAGRSAAGLWSPVGGGRGLYAVCRAVHVHWRPVHRYGSAG